MEQKAKNVRDALTSAIRAKTDDRRQGQDRLKAGNFGSRSDWEMYRFLTGELHKAAHAALADNAPKTAVRTRYQKVADFLAKHGVKIDGEPLEIKSYHVNYLLGLLRRRKITADGQLQDYMRDIDSFRALVETVFWLELNHLPIPATVNSAGSAAKMAKMVDPSSAQTEKAGKAGKAGKAVELPSVELPAIDEMPKIA